MEPCFGGPLMTGTQSFILCSLNQFIRKIEKNSAVTRTLCN